MCGKPTDITSQGTNCTCGCAENLDITSQGTNCTCGCAENPQTSPHRAQTVPVDVRKTYRHHLTGHKLYLWMCGKPTNITSQGTNCTCARAENLQTSPHKVQTVPVHAQKTYRHHLTGYKLYLCTCGKPTDITSQGTNCTCARAENLQTSPHRVQTVPVHARKTFTHLTGHKPYHWIFEKSTDITRQGTNRTTGYSKNPQTRQGTNRTTGYSKTPQTSLDRAQTVPVDVRKTHRHHLTEYKLYIWTWGRLGLPRVRPVILMTSCSVGKRPSSRI